MVDAPGTITVIRGNTLTFDIFFKDSAGDPIDITGYTLWFTVRDKSPSTMIVDDTDAVISKKQLPGEITNPTNGQTGISLDPVDTNIDPKRYMYDIQYSTDGSSRYSSSVGEFIVEGDITRE